MIKGVNLGGWFVLEPWMTPHLFPEVKGYDETRLSKELSSEELKTLLTAHYQSWIQKSDFYDIKEMGLNLVRIPYPWWVFGDVEPYMGSIEYLDQAMEWAVEAGLDVMLDLHTAPGCQNGFDNGGIIGVVDWPTEQANIDKTLDVLVRIANRYKGHKALHSFGILNEPIGSIDINIIKDFYKASEQALRPILGSIPFVFHDSFRLDDWDGFFNQSDFPEAILDTHQYQCFMDEDKALSIDGHFSKNFTYRAKALVASEKKIPTIVGEWSLGLPEKVFQGLDEAGQYSVLRSYADAQLLAMKKCSGWIFWSYKVSDNNSGWNFRELYRKGIFNQFNLK